MLTVTDAFNRLYFTCVTTLHPLYDVYICVFICFGFCFVLAMGTGRLTPLPISWTAPASRLFNSFFTLSLTDSLLLKLSPPSSFFTYTATRVVPFQSSSEPVRGFKYCSPSKMSSPNEYPCVTILRAIRASLQDKFKHVFISYSSFMKTSIILPSYWYVSVGAQCPFTCTFDIVFTVFRIKSELKARNDCPLKINASSPLA